MRKAAAALNVESHTLVSGNAKAKSHQLRIALSSIVYQCDAESMFRSAKGAKQHNTREKDAKRRAVAKLVVEATGQSLPAVTQDLVKQKSMLAHFIKTYSPCTVYSMPRTHLNVVSLAKTLETPITAPTRRLEDDMAEEDCSGMDVEDERSSLVYFQVAVANLSAKKTIKVDGGAGGQLWQDSIAVTLHDEFAGDAGSAIVSTRPSSSSGTADPTFIIEGFRTNANAIEESMVNWNKTSLVWGLPAVEQEGFARQAVHSTLRLFMDRGAVVTSDSAAVPDSMFCGESAQIRDAIVAAGYAQARGTGWTLTLEGANEMMGSKALSSPQPFFRIRDCIALEDMTEYELIKTLQDRGWSWCLWVPPSKRRKKDPPLPIGYRRHDPLVYYSTAKVQCGYLIALAKSED